MKISGLIFGKNITKLHYPIKQTMLSVLPIVDEYIVALGDCDEDDKTREEILSIGSEKIRIIDTVWNTVEFPNGTEMAHQTDIAKSYCTGDWIICLQADEIFHENDLEKIKFRCAQLLDNKNIEGILFKFVHFWGDFTHHVDAHGWHKHEIRIIRNKPDIHSWKDSMSFRLIPNFDGINYRQKENTFKLNVASIDASVYHYGWARPPMIMKIKNNAFGNLFGKSNSSNEIKFEYGPLNQYPVFKGTHPAVMKEWIASFNWANQLQYTGKVNKNRPPHKQEKLKYRLVTFLEKYIFRRPMWEFKNYILKRV